MLIAQKPTIFVRIAQKPISFQSYSTKNSLFRTYTTKASLFRTYSTEASFFVLIAQKPPFFVRIAQKPRISAHATCNVSSGARALKFVCILIYIHTCEHVCKDWRHLRVWHLDSSEPLLLDTAISTTISGGLISVAHTNERRPYR